MMMRAHVGHRETSIGHLTLVFHSLPGTSTELLLLDNDYSGDDFILWARPHKRLPH